MSVDALVKQIEELPADQREELLGRLDELYGEPEGAIELSDEMKALLEERERKYEASPGDLVTWEQVVESLRPRR